MSFAAVTEIKRENELRSARRVSNVTRRERDGIIAMLKVKTLPVVIAQSKRSVRTLLRIAETAHRNGEL